MDEESNKVKLPARKTGRDRKRKPVYGMLPRLLVIGSVVALVMLSCVAVLAKIAQPYAMGAHQSHEISTLQGKLNDLRNQNNMLQIRRNSLDRPEGIECAARSQGYLRQGEVRLVLEHVSPPSSANEMHESFLSRLRSAWLSIFDR